jgi:hypothetical protein
VGVKEVWEERARLVRARKPEKLVEDAVHGMLPKTKMGEHVSQRRSTPVRSSALGAENLARGRVTWQQQRILWNGSPQDVDRPRVSRPGNGS